MRTSAATPAAKRTERNEGQRRKVEMLELVQLRDALNEDGEPEAAAGMQVIIDRGIEEYRRRGDLN